MVIEAYLNIFNALMLYLNCMHTVFFLRIT